MFLGKYRAFHNVLHGFLVINICNHGEHYEKPCIRTVHCEHHVVIEGVFVTQLFSIVQVNVRGQESKDSLPPKMGSICCPKTSVRNYYYSLRNNPKERSSHIIPVHTVTPSSS